MNIKDLTREQFAGLIGVSRERVQQMIRRGTLGPTAEDKIDLEIVLPIYCEYLKSKSPKSKSNDERIKAARAEKLELANEATKRDLIPADEVRREVTRGFQELKTQLLIIPRRLGQPLALETDAVAIEEKIHGEIVSALESQRIKELQEPAK